VNTLYQRLHGHAHDSTADARVRVAVPSSVTGMGPLLVLEVERGPDGRVEQWHFAKPYPVLAFGRVTETARGRSSLYILGGGYSLASGAFVAKSSLRMKRANVESTASKLPEIVKRFRTTHGGRNPSEAFVASIDVPSQLVPIGHLYAVTYDADKGDGVYPYRHPFEGAAQPLVCVDSTGHQLYLVGGAYTVTRHGIEDSE
jgi:hypothetical protein